MKSELKIGDKVRIIGKSRDALLIKKSGMEGMTGIIKALPTKKVFSYYSVELNDYFGGHSCCGICKDGYGRYVHLCDLELIPNVKIKPYTAVRCHTNKEVRLCLNELEKQGYKWRNGLMPTSCGMDKNQAILIVNESISYSDNLSYTSALSQFKYYDYQDLFSPMEKEDEFITIYREGKRVIAEHNKNGEVVNGSIAECHPDDKFIFKFGAELAFERLMENKFTPHLKDLYLKHISRDYGIIGEETNYRDVLGRPLVVGDVVETFWGGVSNGLTNIVKDDDKAFVMGIKSCCNDSTGTIDNWKILKVKGCDEIAHLESVRGITYIKESNM